MGRERDERRVFFKRPGPIEAVSHGVTRRSCVVSVSAFEETPGPSGEVDRGQTAAQGA
jgi:hypothetical protein